MSWERNECEWTIDQSLLSLFAFCTSLILGVVPSKG
jgi:hypothetical protein